jgi:uncharacterized protein YdgA (DUF945 family)
MIHSFESAVMNKKILLGLPLGGIALAAAAYAGTAWYTGTQLEKQINVGISNLAEVSPLLKVVDIKVDRGIFRTTHEMTIGFNSDCFDTVLAAQKPEMQKELDKLTVRLRHTIMHGPLSFADGIKPALAAYEGRVIFDEKTLQELKKFAGDKPALSWNGVLQFDGDYQFKVQSPAFELDKDGTKTTWAGIQGEGSGNIHDVSYKIGLRAPKLAINALASASGKSGDALMENMHIAAEGRIGASKVGIGTATFGIDKFQFADTGKDTQFEMSKLVYAADVKESGEFIDMQAAYKIDSLVFGAEKKKYGPVILEVGLDHLHAPTVLAISKSLNQVMCAKPDQKEAMASEVMGQWKKLAASLLENKPVFQLKQIKFTAPDGELNFNGKISIDGFQPAMLDDSQATMTALPGIVQIEFAGRAPEKLLISSLRDVTAGQSKNQMLLSSAGDVPPEQLKALQESAEQSAKAQLELAITQNFIKQEGDQLTFSFSFGKGQATLNGAPLDLPFLPQRNASVIADNPAAPTSAPAATQ